MSIDAIFDLGIWVYRLPLAERDYARVVEHQFSNLTGGLQNFEDALQLFTVSRTEPKIYNPRWRLLACRQGAMELWHYMHALNAIKSNLGRTSTLKSFVSIRVVQQAITDFSIAFPDVKGVRNSVGHTSELFSSPSEWERNSLREPLTMERANVKEGSIWLDNLMGETFTTTGPDGVFVEYDMSKSSLQKLSEITNVAISSISRYDKRTAMPVENIALTSAERSAEKLDKLQNND